MLPCHGRGQGFESPSGRQIRSIAQPGRVPGLDPGCRRFKSVYSDHFTGVIMKKYLIAGLALLLVTMAAAVPNSDFTWTAPTNYENGNVIDFTADPLTYNLYCGQASGGPYSYVTSFPAGSESANTVDVGSCVNGVAGTYYFVLTAVSPLYNAESAFSNEVSRTYTVQDLGNVPNAPVLLTVQ